MDDLIFSPDTSKNSHNLSTILSKNEEQDSFLDWKKQADQGHAKAQYELAKAYQNGLGVRQNQQLAFQYCKMAADQGYLEAQNTLGTYFDEGKGVEKSPQKAFKYFQLAADQGHPLAQCNLGLYFLNGKGITQSNEKAFYYFKLAADQGLALSQYYVGICFIKRIGVKRSFKEAFKYFHLSADQNYAPGQYLLGLCFYKGYGIKQSYEKAFGYFKLAAKQGFEKAQTFLNENEDLNEIKKRADQGEVAAQIKMGDLYQQGKRLQKSFTEACKYYKLAAEQGHLKSIQLLFNVYHYGQNVEQSYEEALKYLKLGAQINDAKCQYELGRYHKNGWGNLTSSLVEAFRYYKLAAKQGHQRAIKELQPRILHPDAQEVNIQTYLQDQNISTSEAILKSYGNQSIFLERVNFSWEEALAIRDAMIENARFTFMCEYDELSRLFLAFEIAGYDKKKDLKYSLIVNPSTQQETYACVFVGDDIRDKLLRPGFLEDDPQRAEEMLAENERKENIIRAYSIYQTLPEGKIKYPDSQEIDTSNYLSNNNIDTLKTILSLFEDRPAHLYMTKTSYEEIMVIREAMINNPKLCFFCSDWENQIDLEEAFYRAGYGNSCLKKKKEFKNEQKFFGYIFVGKNFK